MPEIGTLNRKQVASMAGLAPWNDDSGSRTGVRHIKGGRGHVRLALFPAALSAIQHNRILKRFYTKMRKRGKPAHVTLAAVMRKLLVYLNHLASSELVVPRRGHKSYSRTALRIAAPASFARHRPKTADSTGSSPGKVGATGSERSPSERPPASRGNRRAAGYRVGGRGIKTRLAPGPRE
jgi:hypothetical protein